jgi:hypothetical protein
MYGNNQSSYSYCNTWSGALEDNIAFSGANDVILPGSWGDFGFSSGNRHLNGSYPYLISEYDLINFHYAGEPAEYFAYDMNSQLTTEESLASHGCTYDYPNFAEEPNGNFTIPSYNFTTLNNNWNSLNYEQINKEGKLGSSSHPEELQREIDLIKAQKSEIVGVVLANITDSDSLILSTWLSRANPKIAEISNYQDLWFKQDFSTLISEIGTPSNDDSEALLESAVFLDSVCNSHKNLDQLSIEDLDSLTNISLSSYGDYTNIIRDYLSFFYDVNISWPVDQSNIAPRSSNSNHYLKDNNSSIFIVYRNLTSECFVIYSTNEIRAKIFCNVFDSQGTLISSGINETGTEICIDQMQPGLYFINAYDQNKGVCETHKLIVPW